MTLHQCNLPLVGECSPGDGDVFDHFALAEDLLGTANRTTNPEFRLAVAACAGVHARLAQVQTMRSTALLAWQGGGSNAELQGERDALIAEIDGRLGDIAKLRSDKSGLAGDVHSLRTERVGLESTVKVLRDEIDLQRDSLSGVNASIEERRETLYDIDIKVAERQAQLDKLDETQRERGGAGLSAGVLHYTPNLTVVVDAQGRTWQRHEGTWTTQGVGGVYIEMTSQQLVALCGPIRRP